MSERLFLLLGNKHLMAGSQLRSAAVYVCDSGPSDCSDAPLHLLKPLDSPQMVLGGAESWSVDKHVSPFFQVLKLNCELKLSLPRIQLQNFMGPFFVSWQLWTWQAASAATFLYCQSISHARFVMWKWFVQDTKGELVPIRCWWWNFGILEVSIPEFSSFCPIGNTLLG